MSQYILEEVLITSAEIKTKVSELAGRISADYEGKDLILAGVLKGAFIFLSDLARELKILACVDFVQASSYGEGTESSGKIVVSKDLGCEIKGRHVLLVEDILDTGHTIKFLREKLLERGPASLEICVLLDKKERRQVPVEIKYTGFFIPDVFVVGYGLDCAENWRCLPDIWKVRVSE